MATIEKRATGQYRARVRKGEVKVSETFRTKAEATAWAARIESDLAAGKRGAAPNRTFGELLERYIEEVIPAKRGARPDTLRLLRIARDEALANVRLPDLGPEHFAAWRNRRLLEVSPNSVRREWGSLSHACSIAVREWRWLPENPMSRVEKPAQTAARTRRVHPDDIERLLLATGYQHEVPNPTQMARVGAAMLFAIETAMRAGEICGLTWEHVDFSRRLAHLPMTKNGHPRDVPLSKEAIRILKQQEQIKIAEEPVFQIKAASLDALFRKAKARALIDDLHFHDTRREALTRLAARVDVMTLAKISGHRDLRILQNTYYAPDMGQVAALLD